MFYRRFFFGNILYDFTVNLIQNFNLFSKIFQNKGKKIDRSSIRKTIAVVEAFQSETGILIKYR